MAGFEELDSPTRIARFSLLQDFVENGIGLYGAEEAVLDGAIFGDEELVSAAEDFRNAHAALRRVLLGYVGEISSYPDDADSAGLLSVGEQPDDAAQRVAADLDAVADSE